MDPKLLASFQAHAKENLGTNGADPDNSETDTPDLEAADGELEGADTGGDDPGNDTPAEEEGAGAGAEDGGNEDGDQPGSEEGEDGGEQDAAAKEGEGEQQAGDELVKNPAHLKRITAQRDAAKHKAAQALKENEDLRRQLMEVAAGKAANEGLRETLSQVLNQNRQPKKEEPPPPFVDDSFFDGLPLPDADPEMFGALRDNQLKPFARKVNEALGQFAKENAALRAQIAEEAKQREVIAGDAKTARQRTEEAANERWRDTKKAALAKKYPDADIDALWRDIQVYGTSDFEEVTTKTGKHTPEQVVDFHAARLAARHKKAPAPKSQNGAPQGSPAYIKNKLAAQKNAAPRSRQAPAVQRPKPAVDFEGGVQGAAEKWMRQKQAQGSTG